MNILTPYSKRLAGFSLVEMAIVILIAGIMMSAGITLLNAKTAAAQMEATRSHQETIKQALINYLGKYNRLPCPATTSTGLEDRPATPSPVPPCTSYSGIVPYQILGLERAVALDGWENFIDYVVSPPPNPIPTAPPFNGWLYTYSQTPTLPPLCSPTIPLCSNNPGLAFLQTNTLGQINATVNGASLNIAASLISHGKNGYGAVNIKGGKNDFLTTAGTDEKLNINISPASSVIAIVKRDISDTPAGNAFDDMVMTLSANDLIGPLLANGTFQSAQTALSQANNIVLGVVGTQQPCPLISNPAIGNGCVSPAYYYTVPASPLVGVSALGVIYSPATSYIDATSSSASAAYTLTAGDNSTKSVSINELKGILLRTGF